MSSHLSRNDLHRRYRLFNVRIIPHAPGPRWTVEADGRTLGTAVNLVAAQTLIETYIESEAKRIVEEKNNAQREGTDHSNAPSAEQPRDSGTGQSHNQSNGPGIDEQ